MAFERSLLKEADFQWFVVAQHVPRYQTQFMIPIAEVDITADIPDAAQFWVPRPSEISEDGFSYFHDVWPIVGAQTRWTAEVIKAERIGVSYLDSHAENDEAFETLASEVESLNDASSDPDDLLLLDALCPDGAEWSGLGGLDIGVAGLVYALSNSGFYPAASCRSHYELSWSPCPVVLFAADEVRVRRLQPIVKEANCGFAWDATRAELLAIDAATVTAMMDLAEALFARRVEFKHIPKTSRVRHESSHPTIEQPFLF